MTSVFDPWIKERHITPNRHLLLTLILTIFPKVAKFRLVKYKAPINAIICLSIEIECFTRGAHLHRSMPTGGDFEPINLDERLFSDKIGCKVTKKF